MTTPTDLPTPDTDVDRPHKPADDREEIYFEGTPLLRGEVGAVAIYWLIAIVIIAAPFVWAAFGSSWLPWFVTLGCIVIGLGVAVVPLIQTRTVRYRISNYRIDYERGILSRNIDTLELWHVEDLSFHQSLIDRILNVGTITIISHDETNPHLTMHGLPNPRPLYESLKQRVIAVKRQRGVIKMDVG